MYTKSSHSHSRSNGHKWTHMKTEKTVFTLSKRKRRILPFFTKMTDPSLFPAVRQKWQIGASGIGRSEQCAFLGACSDCKCTFNLKRGARQTCSGWLRVGARGWRHVGVFGKRVDSCAGRRWANQTSDADDAKLAVMQALHMGEEVMPAAMADRPAELRLVPANVLKEKGHETTSFSMRCTQLEKVFQTERAAVVGEQEARSRCGAR